MTTTQIQQDLSILESPSKLNPSVYIPAFVLLGTLMVWLSGSMTLAFVWVILIAATWIIGETFATTVFSHRCLTHGAWLPKARWYVQFWLFWSRSGMVKFWEWVQNHARHHVEVDTENDSYTPNAHMTAIDYPPLPRPGLLRCWYNAVAYTRTSKLLEREPWRLEQLAAEHEEVSSALRRLDALKWARKSYGSVWFGFILNLSLFTAASIPLAARLGGWWIPGVLVVTPWLMIGLKAYLYVQGGYIINYFGHQADSDPYQSNIPWWIMLITLFVFGEGWHELHHDAPFSARFHRWLDPGWWLIRVSKWLGLAGDIVVATRISGRRYIPERV